MLPSKLFKMTTNVSGILLQLEKAGIRLEIGDDFAKYRTYRTRQLDRGPIYPMFDVASSYVDSTNGFNGPTLPDGPAGQISTASEITKASSSSTPR